MHSDVLVLNRNFFAIQITSWQRALTLVYADHARVVDTEYRTYTFDDWCELSALLADHPAGFVRTPEFKIAIPEVIALRMYDKLPRMEVKFTRRNIYEHYQYRCCYCGHKFPTTELNLEHVVPRSRGGKSTWDNVVTSCVTCNLKKGNKLLHESGMTLLIKPAKPRWNRGLSLMVCPNIRMRVSWQKFIDTVYWNSELKD
jgi:5-methylcytosine-specific restriction endonuclease McrA